ncbi:MAG: hypothetical protein Kow0090_08130 [Myxococcota bacterium]
MPLLALLIAVIGVFAFLQKSAFAQATDEDVDYGAIEERLKEQESEITKAENSISFLRKQYIKYDTETKEIRVKKRLMEAESFYHGGDFTRASIIIYELVSDPPSLRDSTSPVPEIADSQSAVYFEAEKILADALFADKNYFAARKYYHDLYLRGGARYAQDALLKLIQIAGLTQRYDELDEYRSQMARIPDAQIIPEVRYLFGKTLFVKGDVTAAISELQNIRPEQKFYFKARYLIGAIYSAQNKLEEAQTVFSEILNLEPKNKGENAVKDLAKLAIGRIKYTQGDYDAAQQSYQSIDRSSPYFNESLYETGWSFINRNKLDAAIKILDLYILSLEDELKLPHARVVQARLWLRNGDFDRATEEMEFIIREYQAAKDEIERIASLYKDPEIYYYQVTGRTPPQGSAAITGEALPGAAVKWAAREKRMKSALNISDELETNIKALDHANIYSKRIVKLLSGKNIVDMFDALKEAKTRSLTVEANLLVAERRLSDLNAEIISFSMSQENKQRLQAVKKQREELQKKIDAMPKSEKQYLIRLEEISGQINSLDEVLTLLKAHLKGYIKQLNAIERNLTENRREIIRDPQVERTFLSRLADEKNIIIDYDNKVESIKKTLSEMKDELGIGETSATDAAIKKQYLEAIAEERAILEKFKGNMSAKAIALSQKIENDFKQIAAARQSLEDFNRELDKIVAQKGGSLKEDIIKESEQLAKYAYILEELQKETEQVAGGIAMASLGKVKDKFYNILLEANVGLIDVAWRKKEVKTEAINKLVQVKNRELRALEREFKEVRETIVE